VITLAPVNAFTPAQAAGAPYSCAQPWLELCRKVYGYDLRLFLVAQDGAPIGGFCCAVVRSALFGNRLISMPFSDEPGLWLNPGTRLPEGGQAALGAALAGALDALAAETGAAYAELRGAAGAYAAGGLQETSPYLRLVLDTTRPYAALRENFHINLLKNLRKADKTVEVRETRDPAAAAGVYGVYLSQMRRFGSPPLPAAHFEALLRSGLGRLYIASVNGAEAAFLFALVRDGVFYADVNAGLPAHDAYFPKIRLFDETIRLACREGLRAYDLMRTRPAGGVYEHKKKWGGAELPIKYYFRTYRPGVKPGLDPEDVRFALPRLLLKCAPLCLLRSAGPAVRRHAAK
jgi:hypothetical protein